MPTSQINLDDPIVRKTYISHVSSRSVPLVEISLSHNSPVCSRLAMEATLDAPADMASFFNPLRKAHCMSGGLHTPPSSPESNGSPKRAGPRLHLSKLLQKGDKLPPKRSRRATNGATPSASCTKRGSKSAFRAVTEMKKPFPLMLPDSPALTDEISHDDEKQRLRRVSASYVDLRALAQGPSGPSTSVLLPSPMFMPGHDQKQANSYFAYPKRRHTPPPEDEGNDAPYEVHRIISDYCTRERWSLLLDEVRQSKQASQLRHASSPWTQTRKTTPTSPHLLSQSPSPKKRDRTYSTESEWLANTMSHEARVRRSKQRCFQIVQHPARRNAPARAEGEDQIVSGFFLVVTSSNVTADARHRSRRPRQAEAGTNTASSLWHESIIAKQIIAGNYNHRRRRTLPNNTASAA